MPDASRQDEIERATRARLARLAAVPVDMSALERRLKAAMAPETSPAAVPLYRRWKPLLAAAAAIALVASAGILIVSLSGSPAVAAPSDLARLHREVVAQLASAPTVDSIEAANRAIAAQWSEAPSLPAPSADHVMTCCMHELKGRKLACVLMQQGRTPITMVVAHAQQVKPMQGNVVERDGRRYAVHSMEGVQMVMMEHAGRYVCVMGEIPSEQLLEIAAGLSF